MRLYPALRRLAPFLAGLLLVGCGGSSSGGESRNQSALPPSDSKLPAPVINLAVYQPAVLVDWHWQLQRETAVIPGVELYDLDLFDTSAERIGELQAAGSRVICYFSGDSYEEWRPDAAVFPQNTLGKPLEDWADLATEKGCDGVEPDNMHGYANGSDFDFKPADQLVFNRRIANAAHQRGLSVGLKNDLDQIGALVDYFDLAVNRQFSTLVLPLELDGTYRFSCR